MLRNIGVHATNLIILIMLSFLIDLSKFLHGDVSKLFKIANYFFPLKVTITIIF